MMHKLSIILVSVLACGVGDRVARGAVVTRTFSNLTLNATNSDAFALDVDLDGIVDFNFDTFFSNDPAFQLGFDQVTVPFGRPNGIVIDAQLNDGFPNASLLTAGSFIGPGSLFSNGSFDQVNLYSSDPLSGGETGNFGGRRGFLGFRFDTGGQLKFGFADISVNALNSASPFDLTLFSVSFEDVAGQGIVAGQITAVPEPASGLLLGIGSIAAVVVRRLRKQRGKVGESDAKLSLN